MAVGSSESTVGADDATNLDVATDLLLEAQRLVQQADAHIEVETPQLCQPKPALKVELELNQKAFIPYDLLAENVTTVELPTRTHLNILPFQARDAARMARHPIQIFVN